MIENVSPMAREDLDTTFENKETASARFNKVFDVLFANTELDQKQKLFIERVKKVMEVNGFVRFGEVFRAPAIKAAYGAPEKIYKLLGGEERFREIEKNIDDVLSGKENVSQGDFSHSVIRELSIGDQFRNTATGEVSKVTKLTGALPWYTDDCTVVRENGDFIITENIGKKDLLNSEKYEFIGNETLHTEEMMSDYIPYNKKKVITATRIGAFYEFYGDDAKELSEKFNLTLTERGGKPMVGVPKHRFDDFCGELYDKGYIVTNWQHYQDVIKPQVEKNPSMIRAETLINEFCENEYESEGDFTNRLRVGLAYTDDEETGYPIEVYADLEYNRIITEFNNVIVSEEKYKSLDEMCNLALEHLDFDDLVYLPEDQRIKGISKTKDDAESQEPKRLS